MPIKPFRFIHASNLLLDHRLEAVNAFDKELRVKAEDATLQAARNIVESCIADRVDFLLLVGNTFDAADHSLRSQLVLVECAERLAEYHIPIYLVPGKTDPAEVWRTTIPMPENIHLLLDEGVEAKIERDGEVLASIHHLNTIRPVAGGHAFASAFPIAARATPLPKSDENQPTLALSEEPDDKYGRLSHESDHNFNRIGYWALGTGGLRRTVYAHGVVAHDPGGSQAIGPHQTGPHGCTLVEVGQDAVCTLTFLPAAPIRWEFATLQVEQETNHDNLGSQVRESLSAIHRHPTDELYLLSWKVTGHGPFAEAVTSQEISRLADCFLRGEAAGTEIQLRSASTQFVDSAQVDRYEAMPETLVTDYIENLTHQRHDQYAKLQEVLAASAQGDGPRFAELKDLADQLDEVNIFNRALDLGGHWFAEQAEEAA